MAALLLNAAACVLVTLLRMLSMTKRCAAKPFRSASNGDDDRVVGRAERDVLLRAAAAAAEGHVAPTEGPLVDKP